VLVRLGLVVTVVVAAGARPAHALKPKAHAAITEASCTGAGLPRAFCKRVATEDYNVDAREWEDMAAHAQIADGQTACEAAEHTVDYVRSRSEELQRAITVIAAGARGEDDIAAAGIALGRLMHSVQDQCAHRGMPNAQHAWFSLSDFCEDTNLSPDTQDDALACARRESDAVMARVAAVIRASGVSNALARGSCPEDVFHDHNNEQPICDRRVLPGPFDACEFLSEANDWDGIDRQWNGDVVASALRDALAVGLAGGGASASLCERVDLEADANDVVDVSIGVPTCKRIDVLCLGKVDAADNPFGEDSASDASGCAAVGHESAGGLLLLLALRRRRRKQ